MGKGQDLEKINRKIWKEYPLFRDISPKVSNTSDGGVVLSYSRRSKTEDGLPITLSLRVTVDKNGTIKSVSASK